MHPNITEQLRGMRQILAEVIAPEVTGAYPTDILGGILSQLEMLERSWSLLLPYLVRDNLAMEALVERASTVVSPGLAARMREALAGNRPDPSAIDAVDAHNERLRALVADAVTELAGGGADPSGERAACALAIRAHLRDRLADFPLTTTAAMPSGR